MNNSLPGIYGMGVITLAVSTLVWGASLWHFTGREKRFLWLLLPALPLSWAVNALVKTPLTQWVGHATGVPLAMNPAAPLWFKLYVAFLAPVTEEAIKLLPLLLALAIWPGFRDRRSTLYAGLALGLSFGLGEVIYLAYAIGKAPLYAAYPWFAFTGFFSERIAAVFVHGALVAISASGIARGGWWAPLGYLAAILGHVFANLGAILIPMRILDPLTAQVPLLAAIFVLWLALVRLRKAVKPAGAGAVAAYADNNDLIPAPAEAEINKNR
jgi:hypothetical protein